MITGNVETDTNIAIAFLFIMMTGLSISVIKIVAKFGIVIINKKGLNKINKYQQKYIIIWGVGIPVLTTILFITIQIPYTEVPFIFQLVINAGVSIFFTTAIGGIKLMGDIRQGNIG